MATYAIGDLQGCYDQLRRLLDRIQYDPAQDTLWFTGDLVNRGTQSADCLRFVSQTPNAITVLGNHDLALLALVFAENKPPLDHTMDDLLNAPDCESLCHWLRQQPLIHVDQKKGFILVHAGIPPNWELETAQSCAREVEAVLRSDNHKTYLNDLYGNKPDHWDDSLNGQARYRYITNALTRLRYVSQDMQLDLNHKGPIGSQPPELIPWFQHPDRQPINLPIIFGHWASLEGKVAQKSLYALDTGAIWGGKLTALCLESLEFFHSA